MPMYSDDEPDEGFDIESDAEGGGDGRGAGSEIQTSNAKDDTSAGGNAGDKRTAPNADDAEKKEKRKRRPPLQETHLVAANGFTRVLETFPKRLRYAGPGHEREYLRDLMGRYKEWGYQLYNGLAFEDLAERLDKLAAKSRVRDFMDELRTEQRNRHIAATYGDRAAKWAKDRGRVKIKAPKPKPPSSKGAKAAVAAAMATFPTFPQAPVFNRYGPVVTLDAAAAGGASMAAAPAATTAATAMFDHGSDADDALRAAAAATSRVPAAPFDPEVAAHVKRNKQLAMERLRQRQEAAVLERVEAAATEAAEAAAMEEAEAAVMDDAEAMTAEAEPATATTAPLGAGSVTLAALAAAPAALSDDFMDDGLGRQFFEQIAADHPAAFGCSTAAATAASVGDEVTAYGGGAAAGVAAATTAAVILPSWQQQQHYKPRAPLPKNQYAAALAEPDTYDDAFMLPEGSPTGTTGACLGPARAQKAAVEAKEMPSVEEAPAAAVEAEKTSAVEEAPVAAGETPEAAGESAAAAAAAASEAEEAAAVTENVLAAPAAAVAAPGSKARQPATAAAAMSKDEDLDVDTGATVAAQ